MTVVERVYNHEQACSTAGITYKRLDYWTRAGYIGRPGRGTGQPRLWTERDVTKARLAMALINAGFECGEKTFDIAQHLIDTGIYMAGPVGGISLLIVPAPPTQGDQLTTTVPDKLPEFEGTPVAYSAVKFSGTATGFSEGLKIAPVAMHNGQDAYFVIRTTVAAVDHPLDKDELTFRRHDLKIVDMAPVSQDIADEAISNYTAEIQRLKDEALGNQQLDFEHDAADREARDETDTPEQIAAAAAKRAKS